MIITSMALSLSLYFAKPANGQSAFASAAKVRQDAVKTLVADLNIKEFDVKGAISGDLPAPIAKLANSRTIPPEDTSFESSNHLVIDGDMVRYENNHPMWHVEGVLTKKKMVNVCDGKLSKQFFPDGMGTETKVIGIIKRDAVSRQVQTTELAPLLITFRGLNPNISATNLSALKETGQTLPIEGTLCREYFQQYNQSSSIHFWIDPEKDQAIRRITQISQGSEVCRTDVKCRKETIGWVPSSWTVSHFDTKGKTLRTVDVSIAKLAINQTVSASSFELEFPKGTFVEDQRPDRVKYYRVQADGAMREVGPTGDELRDAKVIPQPGSSWLRRNQWFLIGCLVSLILILAMIVRKRYAAREAV
jgi:hypothetical protein